jgi:hypothetical protein
LLRSVGTLEPLEIGLSSIQPLRLVHLAIIAIVFVVRVEANSGVVSGRVVEVSVVVVGLRLGSPYVNDKVIFRSVKLIRIKKVI